MSTPVKRASWLWLAATAAGMFVLFYDWTHNATYEAGILFQLLAWLFSIFGILYWILPVFPGETVVPRSEAQHAFVVLCVAVLMALLLGSGHFVLATFVLLGGAGDSSYRGHFNSDGKPKASA